MRYRYKRIAPHHASILPAPAQSSSRSARLNRWCPASMTHIDGHLLAEGQQPERSGGYCISDLRSFTAVPGVNLVADGLANILVSPQALSSPASPADRRNRHPRPPGDRCGEQALVNWAGLLRARRRTASACRQGRFVSAAGRRAAGRVVVKRFGKILALAIMGLLDPPGRVISARSAEGSRHPPH